MSFVQTWDIWSGATNIWQPASPPDATLQGVWSSPAGHTSYLSVQPACGCQGNHNGMNEIPLISDRGFGWISRISSESQEWYQTIKCELWRILHWSPGNWRATIHCWKKGIGSDQERDKHLSWWWCRKPGKSSKGRQTQGLHRCKVVTQKSKRKEKQVLDFLWNKKWQSKCTGRQRSVFKWRSHR